MQIPWGWRRSNGTLHALTLVHTAPLRPGPACSAPRAAASATRRRTERCSARCAPAPLWTRQLGSARRLAALPTAMCAFQMASQLPARNARLAMALWAISARSARWRAALAATTTPQSARRAWATQPRSTAQRAWRALRAVRPATTLPAAPTVGRETLHGTLHRPSACLATPTAASSVPTTQPTSAR